MEKKYLETVLFQKQNKFIPHLTETNSEENKVTPSFVIAMNENFGSYGYTMSARLLSEVAASTKDSALKFYESFMGILTELYPEMPDPMWPNFPNDVKEVPEAFWYLMNLVHYLTYGEIAPAKETNVKPLPLVDISKLTVIDSAEENAVENMIVAMLCQRVPIQDSDYVFLNKVFSDKEYRETVMSALGGNQIGQKETLAFVSAAYLKDGTVPSCLARQFDNARDVLKMLAVYSGKMPAEYASFRVANMPRRVRSAIMGLMKQIPDIEEYMACDPEMWKRVGEKLHPGDYAKAAKKAYNAFSKIRNGEHIETFMSRFEEMLRNKEYAQAAEHLSARPGMLGRYMDALLRKAEAKPNNEAEVNQILNTFGEVAHKMNPRILLSMRKHFLNRDFEMHLLHTSGPNVVEKESTTETISFPTRYAVVSSIEKAIEKILSEKEPIGKVYVDATASDIMMPDTLRNINKSLHTMAIGSKVKLDGEGDILRAFLYWNKEKKDAGADNVDKHPHVDLDLSAQTMDENFKKISYISFFECKDRKINGVHSGDVRYIMPGGSTEYIDLDMEKAVQNGYRYVTLAVNSFSGQAFSTLTDCFCGFMLRDGKTGEIFHPKTVKNRLDLTSAAREIVAVVVDVKTRDVYMVDSSLYSGIGANIDDQSDSISAISKYVVEMKGMSIMDMAKHAERAGYLQLVSEPEQADIVISNENVTVKEKAKLISLYDVNALVSLFV